MYEGYCIQQKVHWLRFNEVKGLKYLQAVSKVQKSVFACRIRLAVCARNLNS